MLLRGEGAPTPHQVGAVLERQQPRRQLAGPHHGRQHHGAAVVDAVARDWDARGLGGRHGVSCHAGERAEHDMSGEGRRRGGKLVDQNSAPHRFQGGTSVAVVDT